MSNSEHLEILRQGPRVWNAWRAENPSVVPDLNGISLSISDRQMGPINGGPINLSQALLCDATLYFATLTGADLRGADLTNANLRGARLEGADLTGAEFSGAELDSVDLAGATLKATNLSGASLSDARNLTTEQIEEAEGDTSTILPPDLERPYVWSVGAGGQRLPRQQVTSDRQEIDRAEMDAPPEIAVGGTAKSPANASAFEHRRETEDGTQSAEASQRQENSQLARPQGDRPEQKEQKPQRPMLEKLGLRKPKLAKPKQTGLRVEQENLRGRPALPVAAPFDGATRKRSFGSPPQAAPANDLRSAPRRPAPTPIDTSGTRSDEDEDRHITWIVGGPRRVGR